jgi:ABC-type transport system involved in multi-copper enzyme maturation permease subunit
MNTLLRKEIRMLLPVFAAALVLAIVPVWLLPVDRLNPGAIPSLLFFFGVMMIALSSFGREVGLKTIPFILAQPLERARIWRTKIAVLAVFLAVAFAAWWYSTGLRSILHPELRRMPELLAFSGVSVATYAAGGVWMTLLLRQIIAAFWLAILIPGGIGIAMEAMGATDRVVLIALGFYSAAAFFLARRQFLHFQDTAWTGGNVTFARRRAIATVALRRERGPWRALLRKELALHEVTLAGMAALFVLHLGVMALRKVGIHNFGQMTRLALESFSLFWVVVPLVAGSQSVAEERQIGTLDGALCLPISRRAQFAIKLVFVLVLGGLVSATLMRVAEGIGSVIGAGTGNVVGDAFEYGHMVTLFLLLSLFSFYASTLTRSVVQALAAGVLVAVVFWRLAAITDRPVQFPVIGRQLWQAMAYPAVTLAIICLAYGNFKWLLESGRRWLKNALVLTAVIVFASGAAAAVYHRVWELAMPLEGAHGPARLPLGKPVTFRARWGNAVAAILPDGRLWLDRVVYGGRPTASGGYFAPGSNWVDVALLAEETVAIRSDGTLWVSEKLGWRETLAQYVQESGWQNVARFSAYSVVLLKRDGTLWSLGPDAFSPDRLVKNRRAGFWSVGTNIFKGDYPGLRAAAPRQAGSDRDWARMIEWNGFIYAWKRDGDAWAWHQPEPREAWTNRRLPALDHLQFRSVSPSGLAIWIRDDGTLWWHRMVAVGNKRAGPELVQIGKDSDWMAVVSGPDLLALKTDGSQWKWKPLPYGESINSVLQEAPDRLGRHNDWVGLAYWMDQSVALAADGTIWGWPRQDRNSGDSDAWLAPSRRPARIENILDARE